MRLPSSTGLSPTRRYAFSTQSSVRDARPLQTIAEKIQSTQRATDWIEENVIDPTTVNQMTWDFSTARNLSLANFQRRILNKVLTLDGDGLFPYRTVVWSQIKKSGKTQIAGAVGAWFASQIEAPNLVLTVANNQEQSAGRIFDALKPTLKHLGSDVPSAKNATPQILLSNGTIIKAIPNNYEGQAGANYGLTLWSELWAFASERGTRIYEELVPVPTRKNSMRWIETYAGFEDESELLLSIFLKIFTDTTEQELQPRAEAVPGLEDIRTNGRPACYHIPEEGLFVFWDHERRMPWQQGRQGDRYYASLDLRESAYVRLCENRWQKSESTFIHEDWWKRSQTLDTFAQGKMILCLDASQRHDTCSAVGVLPPGDDGRYKTAYCSVHDPKGQDIDLEETLAADVIGLVRAGRIAMKYNETLKRFAHEIYYDPTQMHQVAMNLRKQKIDCFEFNQGNERTLADTFLYQQYKHGNIDNPDHPDLKEHVANAKAKEVEGEKLRIIKGTASGNDTKTKTGHIDACVAQSMAVWKASQHGQLKKPRPRSVIAQATTKGLHRT